MICVMPIIGRHGLHIHVLHHSQEQKHRPRQVPSEFCLGSRSHAFVERFSSGTSPVDWPGFSLDLATVSAVLHKGKVQGAHSFDSFREGRNFKGKFEIISSTFFLLFGSLRKATITRSMAAFVLDWFATTPYHVHRSAQRQLQQLFTGRRSIQ